MDTIVRDGKRVAVLEGWWDMSGTKYHRLVVAGEKYVSCLCGAFSFALLSYLTQETTVAPNPKGHCKRCETILSKERE